MTSELEKKIPDIRERMEEDTAYSLKREGLKAGEVEPWEDGYRTKDKPDTFEWWYFDAEFDDGGKAVVVFNTSPLTHPKGPLRPSLLLIMKNPEGKSVRLIPEFKPEELSSAAEGCDVSIGKNHVKGDLDRYELHAEVESYAADLTYTRMAPSWRPGSGVSYSGRDKSKYFGWVVPIPYGTVEGTVVFDGEKRQVKGTCYHDHNWGNVSPGLAIDHWYWGRAHVGDFTIIFVEMVTRHVMGMGSMKLHTFMLARGNEIITDDGLPLSLATSDFADGPGGRTYPEKLDWEWNGEEGKATLTLRNPEMIESIDMLEGTPKWTRPLIHLVASPYYYDFIADLELTVDIKGVKASERGRALYELMMLK
jgi:Svf1-like C-terminal lipocalin-like domain/CrtC N-terminal lipocalin domain